MGQLASLEQELTETAKTYAQKRQEEIASVWGTLIGADLLNLHRLRKLGAHALSIRGAGMFDGIFLVGVVAALLA